MRAAPMVVTVFTALVLTVGCAGAARPARDPGSTPSAVSTAPAVSTTSAISSVAASSAAPSAGLSIVPKSPALALRPAVVDGRLSAPFSFDNEVLTPPAAADGPRVTSAAALATLTRGMPGIGQHLEPLTFLATYTRDGGATVSMWPLVWVFLYVGVLVAPSCPAHAAGETGSPCLPSYEDEVGLVSALTGRPAGFLTSLPNPVAWPVPTGASTIVAR
jgi:hypothetical protein